MMSSLVYIIPSAWVASGILSIWLCKWLADDSDLPFVPNWQMAMVIGPVFLPILLFYFVKRQLFYRTILLYVRLLEIKNKLKMQRNKEDKNE